MTDSLGDMAGRAYWDSVWNSQAIPNAINPRATSLRNYMYRCYHEYFANAFADRRFRDQSLLEIGCGRSRWLPYLGREFGFTVSGIDYSAIGCEQARAILNRSGVSGTIVQADFTAPPDDMVEAFDIVVSFGLIEHFEDTASCVANLARFLKPGGLMFSMIPNLVGGTGWLQKHLCRSVYDVHKLLDREMLQHAHEQAGLTVQSCDYFMSGGLSTLNLSCWSDSRLYPVLRLMPLGISLPVWFLEDNRVKLKPNRFTSPGIVCLAQT